jgi:hypothetical protein
VQGVTNSSTTREYLVNIGLSSNRGIGIGTPNGDKVALYAGADATAGTGDVWPFNPLVTQEAGSGSYNAQGIELDFNNSNAHRGEADGGAGLAAPVSYGLAITGAGSFRSTAAQLIAGDINGDIAQGGIWNRGIVIANNSVKQSSFQDLGNASTSIDVPGSHTYDALFNGGGNVGIGTSSPTAKLQVKGASRGPAVSGNSLGDLVLQSGGTFGLSLGTYDSGVQYGWIQSQYVNSAGSVRSLVLNPIGGNVGIGTTTPWGRLSITGLDTSGATPTFVAADSNNNPILMDNGNVGIGTTSPSRALEILSTSPQLRLTYDATHYGDVQADGSGNLKLIPSAGTIYLDNPTAAFNIFKSGTLTNAFNVAGSSYITGGNLGIGTTTPGSLLSLNGIANFTTATSTFYSTGGINLGAGCFAIGGNCLSLSNISGTLAINQGGTGQTSFGQGWLNSNGTTISASTSPTVNYITATSTTATSTFALGGFVIGSNNFVVKQGSGSVGIGTNSPQTKLHVLDSVAGIDSVLSLENNSTANAIKSVEDDFYAADTVGTRKQTADISSIGETSNFVDADLLFKTRSSNSVVERMRIMASGNVGIGTTTPYARLEVWGTDTASTSAFVVANSASTTVFAVYNNGNTTYSGSIFQSSDQRLKTDRRRVGNGRKRLPTRFVPTAEPGFRCWPASGEHGAGGPDRL